MRKEVREEKYSVERRMGKVKKSVERRGEGRRKEKMLRGER